MAAVERLFQASQPGDRLRIPAEMDEGDRFPWSQGVFQGTESVYDQSRDGFHRSGNVRRRVHAGTPAAGAGREELSGQPHFLGREDRGDAP